MHVDRRICVAVINVTTVISVNYFSHMHFVLPRHGALLILRGVWCEIAGGPTNDAQ